MPGKDLADIPANVGRCGVVSGQRGLRSTCHRTRKLNREPDASRDDHDLANSHSEKSKFGLDQKVTELGDNDEVAV